MTRYVRARTAAASPDQRQALHAAALVLCGAIVFANGLGGPFVIDDSTAIESNMTIRRLLPLSEALSPPRDTPVAGRPLVNLSFALNFAVSGLDPRGYRITNLAIHLLAALVLFGVVRRTLEREGMPLALRSHARDAAFACALIWTIHPLQTEVVNYVTQRTSSLKGLLYLLTLYCSIRGLGARHGRWHATAVAACAAGMASKESMATAPLLVALYDRTFVYGSFRQAFRERWRLYAALAATWLIVAALLATGPRSTAGFGSGVDPMTYLLNQATVIVDYLRLTFLPRALVLDYGIPRSLTIADVVAPGLVVAGLVVVTVVALARWPRIGFLGAWFFVTLAPTSSFVPIATEVGAERRMYLPLAAIVVLAVCGTIVALAGRRVSRRAASGVLAVVCVLLAGTTVLRNFEYRSGLSLARVTVERRPHGRAFLRLGVLLFEAGRRAEAFDYTYRAKAQNAVGARFVLGTEYLVEGRIDEGIRELTEFLHRHPNHSNTINAREMLGRVHLARGDLDAARREFGAILQSVPGHLRANEGMGDVLLAQARMADALPHLEYVARRRAGDVTALGKLGTALLAVHRADDAVEILRSAVAAAPGHPHARRMLGRALATVGRFEEALAQLEQAVELDPANAAARRDLEDVRGRLRW
jgi:Flp pilus assembly protein TadD